jgi:hypothetical protein
MITTNNNTKGTLNQSVKPSSKILNIIGTPSPN